MIATLALRLFGAAAPTWLTAPIKWLIDIAMILAILGGVYAWIYHSGEKAGGAKVTAKVEEQHAKTVAEAKADTTTAQSTATAIGATTAHNNQAATEAVQQKTEEMHHAIDVSAAPAGAPPPRIDTASLSASTDSLIDRANRAADAADAQP